MFTNGDATNRNSPQTQRTTPITDISSSHTLMYRLTTFPAEIWDHVFTLLLVNPSSITYNNLRQKRVAGSPIAPIMLVCKSWYERARFIFHAKNHFKFDTLSHLTMSLKHMTLESRQDLRSVEVQWGLGRAVERNSMTHALRECISLQIFRVEFPHSYSGVFQIGADMLRSKLHRVLKDMRDLKEFTILCPETTWKSSARWSCFVLGTEPTMVKEP